MLHKLPQMIIQCTHDGDVGQFSNLKEDPVNEVILRPEPRSLKRGVKTLPGIIFHCSLAQWIYICAE